jgi:hypothetical protein
MTTEPIARPVTLRSGGCEFLPEIATYRVVFGATVFGRLGRPTFFAEAADLVQLHVGYKSNQLQKS